MSVITFWNNGKHLTDQTISMIAIATELAIEHNYKVLLVNARKNDKTMEDAFWNLEQKNKVKVNTTKTDIGSGITGLIKAVASNKITPEIITNYTKIVFKDRLEILTNVEDIDDEEYIRQKQYMKEMIKIANKYYDLVFVDIEGEIRDEVIQSVINTSDIVVVNISQKMRSILDYMKIKSEINLINREKRMVIIGRYDKFSKYNLKNVIAYIKEKEIFAIPYGTVFYEACYEGELVNYFLKFKKVRESNPNSEIISSVNKASERILSKLKEMNLKVY